MVKDGVELLDCHAVLAMTEVNLTKADRYA
jgi:hypothetical protein